MSQQASQLKTISRNVHRATNALLVLAMFGASLWVFSLSASADTPSNDRDPLIDYCSKLKLNSKAEDACADQDSLSTVRLYATWQCDGSASSDEKVACVLKESKAFIKKAAETKPNSASKYDDAIYKVITKPHGVKTAQAPGFGQSEGSVGNSVDPAIDPGVECNNNNCDFIKKYVNPAINVLTISFGLIAVISIILGAINYTTSEGDPQKVSRAKNRLFNTIIAIVAYMFLYAFLQFLIPGGAFK